MQEDLGLFQTIEERHSVKNYDPDFVLSQEDLEDILHAANLAPSSWNLQHWRFLVINEQSKQEELLPIAYNQQQIVDASAVIAILGDLEANKEADSITQSAVDAGFMSGEVKHLLVDQINKAYESSAAVGHQLALVNASLAAMNLMLAAKAKGFDTCPMGGFNAQKFLESFDIPKRYVPIMLISLGKALKPAHRSSRKPLSEKVFYNTMK
ncbi:nitroreductase family protein [Alkalicoccobacillus porphyridii]|uniref:Nitroreductase family protein n=1 Tax=Alkalicoccobacillus porphyridii TaxID=2597270 RepID=A0A553ZUR2_9BACI|nr:nitroreductase family protein [Alkalicoccobacillus porphyridii]